MRWSAGKALQSGVAQGKFTRTDLQVALVRAVEQEPADDELATSARYELLAMRPLEIADKVRELAARGLVVADEVGRETLDERLQPKPADWADLRARWRSEAEYFAPDDVHDPQRWWMFFPADAAHAQANPETGSATAALVAKRSAAQAAAAAAKKKQRNKLAKQARKGNRKK